MQYPHNTLTPLSRLFAISCVIALYLGTVSPTYAQSKNEKKGATTQKVVKKKAPTAAKTVKASTTKPAAPKANPASAPAPAAQPAAAPATSQQDKLAAQNKELEKEPTYIKADTLTVKQKDRYFLYSGNVSVKKGDLNLVADEMDGTYDEQNQIQEIVARKNVVVKKGPGITARGDRAVYQRASDTVTLTDNPELQQDGNVLTADKIKIFLKDNRSTAEGQVRMKMIKGSEDSSFGEITKTLR